jgi:hypothetical protein
MLLPIDRRWLHWVRVDRVPAAAAPPLLTCHKTQIIIIITTSYIGQLMFCWVILSF